MMRKSENQITTDHPPIVVTVVEAGPLEKQVLLMVESLRRWGGRLASARIMAINPRNGPRLAPATVRAFEKFNVEFSRIVRQDGLDWFPYLNKTAATKYVAELNPSANIIWLDADVLILREPSDLILDDQICFAACASDKNIGTSRDDDEYAPYFKACCSALGVDYFSLPYVRTEAEHALIRAYWNSGVFSFTADSGLAETHHQFTLALVSKRIASFQSKLFFSDQIALGIAAHALALPTRNLKLTHNFSLQPTTISKSLSRATDVRILHYHGCMWPNSFDALCSGIRLINSEAASWLRAKGPLKVEIPTMSRLHRKILEIYRSKLYAQHLATCIYS